MTAKANAYFSFDRKGLRPGESVLGVDEVGRGSWAGDLVVCGVLADGNWFHPDVKDSKLLTPSRRAEIYASANRNGVVYAIERLGPADVDALGPKRATRILMARIVRRLGGRAAKILIDYEVLPDAGFACASLPKGDRVSYAIAAASVIAKHVRDQAMDELDAKHPGYGFGSNKGYGTKRHREALAARGPIPGVHRFSYRPIKLLKLFR